MHFVRLILLLEDAPPFAPPVPEREWISEASVDRVAEQLDRSAGAVRQAVESLIRSQGRTELHYDHPFLFLQHNDLA